MATNQPDSLVQYGVPQLVSTSAANKKGQKKKQAQVGTLEKAGTTRNEDYLNSILPPREHTEQGNLWVRYVSATPGSKVDVMNLQEQLDKRLGAR